MEPDNPPEGAPKERGWFGILLYLVLAVLGLMVAAFFVFLIKIKGPL